MPEQFWELGKYGASGVMIALIFVILTLVYVIYKLTSNHINHSNTIFNNNTEALTHLKDFIKQDIQVTKELKEEIRRNKQ